jgi:peptidase E
MQALMAWSPHFVYVEGGNTFWLHRCLTKDRWQEALSATICAENGAVYCGKSAGAIIAGALVETACWKVSVLVAIQRFFVVRKPFPLSDIMAVSL